MASPWLGASVDGDPLQRALALREAHEQVLNGRARQRILRELVADSWTRSVQAGVDPTLPAPRILSESDAAGRLAAHKLGRVVPLLRTMLSSVAEDARHIMVLSDADGLLLWAEGYSKMLAAAATTQFLPGALCSESAVGTNVVGTALALDHPVQIFSAEHFSELFFGWTCSAAPIHDPTTGTILGVLNLSGNFRTAHPHTLSLVAAVAQAAESQLALDSMRRDNQLRARYLALVMRSPNRPSALIAGDGRVVISTPPSWLPERVTVPVGGGRFPLSDGLEVIAEPLATGQAHLVWQAGRAGCDAPRATLRVDALGRRRATISQLGSRVELSPRHSEILTLLALNLDGLSGEDLAVQLYGSHAKSVTVRAEISRLRKLLSCRLIPNPYRLMADVRADFIEVVRLLDTGDLIRAAQHYRGPLLIRSRVPQIVAEREWIERRLGSSTAPCPSLQPPHEAVEPQGHGPETRATSTVS